jgi:hypothetical protein
MQHLPIIQVARRVLRAAICPSCYQRQPHDELLAPSVPRACEAQCALFQHVAVLVGIAVGHVDIDQPGDCDREVLKRVCRKSCTRPSAGDYCVYWLNRTCPLSRFGVQAVAVLQALPALHALANHRCPLMTRCPHCTESHEYPRPPRAGAADVAGHSTN